jgi:hypothetical protein
MNRFIAIWFWFMSGNFGCFAADIFQRVLQFTNNITGKSREGLDFDHRMF